VEDDIENEIRAVLKLCVRGHQNIVRLIGHNWLHGSSYYAIDMELCDLTLAEFVNGKREVVERSWSENLEGYNDAEEACQYWLGICSIFVDITNGLSFIHSFKEIHRDLKPSNGVVHSGKYG
jgi:serine/threonine protein kinase